MPQQNPLILVMEADSCLDQSAAGCLKYTRPSPECVCACVSERVFVCVFDVCFKSDIYIAIDLFIKKKWKTKNVFVTLLLVGGSS